jgi:DNA-binding LacI/PurR family transcriptional regulator
VLALVQPRLTTFGLNLHAAGCRLGESLVRLLESGQSEVQQTILSPQFFPGESDLVDLA